ncbi:MAG: ribonuclease P protein component [Bacteroidota bacterium]
MRATFDKSERLCSRKVIDSLFSEGSSFLAPPFRVVWRLATLPTDQPAQVAISVPRKRIKKAVTRNRVRRMVREAYRQHKSIHYVPLQTAGDQLAIMLIYLPGKPLPYAELQHKIILTLQRLLQEYEQAGRGSPHRTD